MLVENAALWPFSLAVSLYGLSASNAVVGPGSILPPIGGGGEWPLCRAPLSGEVAPPLPAAYDSQPRRGRMRIGAVNLAPILPPLARPAACRQASCGTWFVKALVPAFAPAREVGIFPRKGPIGPLVFSGAALFCRWLSGGPLAINRVRLSVSDKATEIANLLGPTVTSLGLELLGAEYLPAPGGATLRLYIDVPLAEQAERVVGIEDCERVSREVSAQLDVEDPISGNYTLEVSSPGVDRPLFTLEQVARHLGESAKITLKLAQDGRRRLQGRIVRTDSSAGTVTIDIDEGELAVVFDNIDKARIVPDWAALGLAPQKPNKPGPKRPGKTKNKPSNQSAAGKPRAE